MSTGNQQLTCIVGKRESNIFRDSFHGRCGAHTENTYDAVAALCDIANPANNELLLSLSPFVAPSLRFSSKPSPRILDERDGEYRRSDFAGSMTAIERLQRVPDCACRRRRWTGKIDVRDYEPAGMGVSA